jgi:hypothetical protein
MSQLRRSSALVALAIAAVAAVAVAATAIGVGSQVPGKNGVKSSDIAKGAVKTRNLAQPQWVGVKLLNEWRPYGGETRPPKVALDGWKFVHLRGAIRRESGTSLAPFTLPPKYRPSRAIFITVPVHQNTNGQLQILANGQVTIQASPPAQPETLTSLEGVSFHK